MGYIKHHAIAVTSWNKEKLYEAHKKAVNIFGSIVSEIVRSNINSYLSFFIAPNGSKEGWPDSDNGDILRDRFIRWVNKQAYEDDSNCLRFCEFYYGEDNDKSEIIRHN